MRSFQSFYEREAWKIWCPTELSEASLGCASTFEVFNYVDPLSEENSNLSFRVVNQLSRPYYNKGYTVYIGRWFSRPIIFNHLWLGSQWKDVRNVHILCTVHQSEMVGSEGHRGHRKPNQLLSLIITNSKLGWSVAGLLLTVQMVEETLLATLWPSHCDYSNFIQQNTSKGNEASAVHWRTGQRFCFIGWLGRGGPARNLTEAGQLLDPTPTPGSIRWTGQQKCWVCAERGKHTAGKAVRKDMSIMCKYCDVALCIGKCFSAYHKKVKL